VNVLIWVLLIPMMAVAFLAAGVLIGAFLMFLGMFILALACLLAACGVKLSRWLRYRARLRFGKVRVPADGARLTHDETREFVTILRGWKRSVREPVYDERRRQP